MGQSFKQQYRGVRNKSTPLKFRNISYMPYKNKDSEIDYSKKRGPAGVSRPKKQKSVINQRLTIFHMDDVKYIKSFITFLNLKYNLNVKGNIDKAVKTINKINFTKETFRRIQHSYHFPATLSDKLEKEFYDTFNLYEDDDNTFPNVFVGDIKSKIEKKYGFEFGKKYGLSINFNIQHRYIGIQVKILDYIEHVSFTTISSPSPSTQELLLNIKKIIDKKVKICK